MREELKCLLEIYEQAEYVLVERRVVDKSSQCIRETSLAARRVLAF
jgi:hypothetical protein